MPCPGEVENSLGKPWDFPPGKHLSVGFLVGQLGTVLIWSRHLEGPCMVELP